MGLKINVDINNLSTDCNKMTDLISELKILRKRLPMKLLSLTECGTVLQKINL